MINGLSGRPGAGKTYECVVNHILPALQDKRKIVTNIPLNIDWFVNVLGNDIRDLNLIELVEGDFHSYGKKRFFSQASDFLAYSDWRNDKNQGVYFFVDECHLAMPKGGTQTELKEYMSMHRHHGHDIMLITQNFRKVDIDIKDMVQTCYLTTKLSFLGKDNEYVCKVADGVSRNILITHQRKYENKYFGAYKSHTKSEGSVKEQTTSGVHKWYQRWTTKGAIILFVLAFMMIFSNLTREKPDYSKEAQEKLDSLTQTASVPTVTPVQVSHSNSTLPIQSVPTSQSVSQAKPKNTGHPFSNVNIHLSGYYADMTNRGNFQKIYYFSISRNGQMIAELTNADLVLAGYNVKIFNQCAAELSYDDFSMFVLCDTPTQSVTVPGEQLVQNF